MIFVVLAALIAMLIDEGTAAVAIWTPTRVVLAADGKVTRRGDPKVQSFPSCKTRLSGKFGFTAAGFYGQGRPRYDAWSELDSILSTTSDLVEAERRIREELAPKLARSLGEAYQGKPQDLIRDFKESFFSLAVASIEGGRPQMLMINFRRDGNDEMAADTSWYPPLGRAAVDSAVGYSIMGERAAIDRHYSTAQLVALVRSDPIAIARALVELEIREMPTRVGSPLSILEITAAGPRWTERGACGKEGNAKND